MSDKILKIFGRYIYDSRGNPTVEVDLWTSKGTDISSWRLRVFFLGVVVVRQKEREQAEERKRKK